MSGRALTVCELMWRIDGAMVEMSKGTQLDVRMTKRDETSRWRNRLGCVVTEWRDRKRYVPADVMLPLDDGGRRALEAARDAKLAHDAAEAERDRRAKEFDAEVLRKIEEGAAVVSSSYHYEADPT